MMARNDGSGNLMDDEPHTGDRLIPDDLSLPGRNQWMAEIFDMGDIGDWSKYIDGYRQAGALVMQRILGEWGTGHTLLYPAIFL